MFPIFMHIYINQPKSTSVKRRPDLMAAQPSLAEPNLADAIRLNRTDTALVRVVVPVVDRDEAKAQATATDFVQAFYSTLLGYLPS